ncbi:MAG: MFS transporter [Halanaeroarchaeum sp.]
MLRTAIAESEWYYGWVVAVAGFLAATVLFGLSYSFGVFLSPLLSAFDVGSGAVSLTFGLQTFVVYTGAVPGGTVVDSLGARRSSGLATVLVVAGLLGASVVRSFPVLLGWYGIVTGLGMSLLYVVAYTTVPRWFVRRRGLATGFTSSGLGIGILVVAPIAARLVDRFGWRGAYRWLAVGALAVLAVATYLIADRPSDVGEAQTPGFRVAGSATRLSIRERIRDVGRVALTRPFQAVFLGWLFVWTPLYVLLNHVVRFVSVSGLQAGTGVAAISLVGLSTSLARVVVGSIADRVGRVRTFAVSGALVAVAVPATTLADTTVSFLAVAAVFGIGYGGAGALLSPLVAELFGDENLGTTFGLASVAFALGGLAAPTVAGVLFERIGSYDPVFWGAGLIGLVGVGLIRFAGARRASGSAGG